MIRTALLLLLLPVLLLAQDLSQIEMKDVNGDSYAIKNHLDNDGTIVIFWATWCLPCKKEFPAVQKLKEKYPEKNINIVTISKDSPRSLAKVKSFVRSHDYPFTFLLDPTGEVSTKLLVNQVPFTMLVNREGKVIYSLTGYRKGDENELEKQLQKYWQETGDDKE